MMVKQTFDISQHGGDPKISLEIAGITQNDLKANYEALKMLALDLTNPFRGFSNAVGLYGRFVEILGEDTATPIGVFRPVPLRGTRKEEPVEVHVDLSEFITSIPEAIEKEYLAYMSGNLEVKRVPYIAGCSILVRPTTMYFLEGIDDLLFGSITNREMFKTTPNRVILQGETEAITTEHKDDKDYIIRFRIRFDNPEDENNDGRKGFVNCYFRNPSEAEMSLIEPGKPIRLIGRIITFATSSGRNSSEVQVYQVQVYGLQELEN